MKVYFVGAGPGDPELLTIKADRLLRKSHIIIYAGSLVNTEILSLLPEDVEKYQIPPTSIFRKSRPFSSTQKRGVLM